jgi:hypothetical protein
VDRQKWKDVAEAIGFTAVIASLVFVGIETRNSTKQSELTTQALEISAYQALMSNIDDLNMLLIENPSMAPIMDGVWGESDGLDFELFQSNRVLYILFRHGDLAFFMYERGAIDEARLESALGPVPIWTEAGREFWKRRKNAFSENYRNHIDKLMEDSTRSGSPE